MEDVQVYIALVKLFMCDPYNFYDSLRKSLLAFSVLHAADMDIQVLLI